MTRIERRSLESAKDMTSNRPIPDAPPGDDWFEPAGGTRWEKDEYVKILRVGPGLHRYGQVIRIRAKTDEDVLYVVQTIDNESQFTIDDLRTYEIGPARLNAMQVLALQARPDPPPEG